MAKSTSICRAKRSTSYNFLSTTTPLHPLLWPCAPLHIMDTNPRADKSSETPGNHASPDRSPGESLSLTAAATDDTTRSGSAQQPQTQIFTFFKRLPAELRVIIWEFPSAPPGPPRILFLEPIADPHDEGRGPFWDAHWRRWRDNYCHGCERTPRIHWEISARTNDPCFQWPGRELLSVCTEARRVFLDQKATSLTSRREQLQAEFSDIVQTEDIICIRASLRASGNFMDPLYPGLGERQTGFCHHDERPSPRRLALEVPITAVSSSHLSTVSALLPEWLIHYGENQKLMRFDRLEIVYVLNQDIKPRAHYDHQEGMPPDMYTEVFGGHHGSKFVAIDPEDEEALQLWNIPRYCWVILNCARTLPHFLGIVFTSNEVNYCYNQRISEFPPSKVKLRFLACVMESLQTPRVDTESPNSGFAFT